VSPIFASHPVSLLGANTVTGFLAPGFCLSPGFCQDDFESSQKELVAVSAERPGFI
jgi:hypothetical protein